MDWLRDCAGMTFERFKRALPVLGRLYRNRDGLRAQLRASETLRAAEAQNLSPAMVAPFREFIGLVQPMKPVGLAKVRVGREADGGYVMVEDFEGIQTAISIGIGSEVSWDVALADRGMTVLQFDPTITRPPVIRPDLRFEPLGLLAAHQPGIAEPLSGIVSRADGPLVGKIDIEGDEWAALEAASDADLRRFRQLVVEFHGIRNFVDREWRERAMSVLRKIARHMQSVHLHGNNHSGVRVIAGFPFPDTFEVTFLARERCRFSPDDACYPTPLDRPNAPYWADIHLGRWT
jgi:hypothetical protein